MNNSTSPKVLDLFAGCGGMSWGLHKAGFQVIGGIDIWEQALKTFQFNHPDAQVFLGDIAELSTLEVMKLLGLKKGQLDVLMGGPPCQGFSKNQTAANRFIEDPRNQLYKEFMRFVSDLLPKVVVMENVAEIYNAFEGKVRNEIIENFEALGYRLEIKVLTASDFGIPQKRRRCIFLATRGEIDPVFPQPTHISETKSGSLFDLPTHVSAWDAIGNLPKPTTDPKEKLLSNSIPKTEFEKWVNNPEGKVSNHFVHKMQPKQVERYKALQPGEDIRHLPDHLRPKSGFSGAYGRLDFKSVAPTITRWVFHPGSGRYGHPQEPRVLTMREAARLQSFTDDFEFIGTKNEIAGQIGNSVPPLLMFSLAPTILELIQGATD